MPIRATSAIAFAENVASGLIDDLRLLVYRAVYASPNETANEISRQAQFSGYQIDSVRPRFAELQRMGVLEEGTPRKDRYTGKLSITWRITNFVADQRLAKVARPSRAVLEEQLQISQREQAALAEDLAQVRQELALAKQAGRDAANLKAELGRRDAEIGRLNAQIKELKADICQLTGPPPRKKNHSMSKTKRDPIDDPQAGDTVRLLDGKFRRVIKRVENDITYIDQRGKERVCWITTWMEWCRKNDVAEVTAAS